MALKEEQDPDRGLEWAVIDAACEWWRGHRPIGWNETEHLKHPTINMTKRGDAWLARVVSDLVRDQENR